MSNLNDVKLVFNGQNNHFLVNSEIPNNELKSPKICLVNAKRIQGLLNAPDLAMNGDCGESDQFLLPFFVTNPQQEVGTVIEYRFLYSFSNTLLKKNLLFKMGS